MEHEMRRKDRQLSEQDSWAIMNAGKYGVMSVMGTEGYPYGIPLHYAVADGKVYFHSTVEGGFKAESFAQNNKVSFTVVETEDGVKARSAIVFGTVAEAPEMREKVLAMVVEKFVPEFAWEQAKAGIPFAKDAIQAYCITPDKITGKWVDKPEGR